MPPRDILQTVGFIWFVYTMADQIFMGHLMPNLSLLKDSSDTI